MRLTQTYTDTLSQVYQAPSQTLGKALGVAEHAVRVFTDSEVRSSIMLQLSK